MAYQDPAYWDQRFREDPEPFEWFCSFADIKSFIKPHIPDSARVLVVGNGTSRLGHDLLEAGVARVEVTDVSPVAVELLSAGTHPPGLTAQVQDVTALSYPPASFDVVVDKGTLDSLLCGDDSRARVHKFMQNVARVLAPAGKFLAVSYADPDQRNMYISRSEYDWDVTPVKMPKPPIVNLGGDVEVGSSDLWLYVCAKRDE
jgi:SAM-dependent methyltransferase|eukprot:gnl/Ergobibamus_cyprinoides/78.p1 GENE.gnl/Ergobibamus_cyprinoides/78~~gnl/Ergobibamus_cyprinoides/78.p1  ORF type:complete len:202 (+),score=55.17 gnl/Ergobibamus_cyprinoides/78:139-744(+)